MDFVTVNPLTQETIDQFCYLSDAEVQSKIQDAEAVNLRWSSLSIPERITHLQAVAENIESKKIELARVVVAETGKTVTDAQAEIEKCATVFQYYSELASMYLQDQNLIGPYDQNKICFEPLGIVLAIMPWNYPWWQTIRCAVPALIAGNSILLKHSDLTAGTAKLIEEVFFRPGVGSLILNLCISHQQCETVIANRKIKGVSFTGSVKGGRAVAELAGRNLKKIVLELGGSDSYIVAPDAELATAARCLVRARVVNNGQSCIAAKRWYVHHSVQDKFLEFVKKEIDQIQIGDPSDPKSNLGTLAHRKFIQQLSDQVQLLLSSGGRVLAESTQKLSFPFVPIQVIEIANPNQEILDLEIFGPVAILIPYLDFDQAIESINRSCYGLAAGIFSADVESAQKNLVKRLQVGMVTLNDCLRSDVRMPFGGTKESGYGKELGQFGLYEFVNIKTVGVVKS